ASTVKCEQLCECTSAVALPKAWYKVSHRLLDSVVFGIDRLSFYRRLLVEAVIDEPGERLQPSRAIGRSVPCGCEVAKPIGGDFFDGLVAAISRSCQPIADRLVAMDGGKAAFLSVDTVEQCGHVKGFVGLAIDNSWV